MKGFVSTVMATTAMLSIFVIGPADAKSKNNYAKGRNLGHRAGGGPKEYHKHLPENSLSALKASLMGIASERGNPIQYHEDFRYLEFDVRETRDGHLVLFHDKKLTRMLPNKGKNREIIKGLLKELQNQNNNSGLALKYKKLKIKDLSLEQVKSLTLAGSLDERVPTLEEFLTGAREWGLAKPLTLEVKSLSSDSARIRLIELLRDFKESYISRVDVIFEKGYDLDPSGVSLLSFPKSFSSSFGQEGSKTRGQWCGFLKEMGFERIYRALFHRVDLCKK